MTLTISKYQLSKQQHTITLNYTIGENLNHFSHLCRNFFPRIGMRFVKHEMVWLPWQPGPSNNESKDSTNSLRGKILIGLASDPVQSFRRYYRFAILRLCFEAIRLLASKKDDTRSQDQKMWIIISGTFW